jgi:eukaryotic-like serine/threonine-protein kinase
MADHIGQQLGNYRLLGLLGKGGFAEVYLGEHLHLGMKVAVKVLNSQMASDDIERFRTEARTIARLALPTIIPALILLPILLLIYNTIVSRRRRAYSL